MAPIPEVKGKPTAGVCYKQIHNEFHFVWYLDLRIVINKSTGWVNATKFCNDYGKRRFRDWVRCQQTKTLIQEFRKNLDNNEPQQFYNHNLLACDDDSNSSMDSESANELGGENSRGPNDWSVTVNSKGNDETARVTSGTYLHADLVPALAM